MAILFDTDMFDDITLENIIPNPMSFQAIDPVTISIQFAARKHSQDTKLYKITHFMFKGDLLDKPSVYQYAGPSHVVYNSSNNCIKGMDEVVSNQFVMVQCNQHDYEDMRLAKWKKTDTTLNETQVKSSYPWTYVYCYGKNITVNGETTEPCPDFVFRLESETKWDTDDYHYNPEVIELNAQPIEPISIDVHNIHFKEVSHFVSTRLAVEKLQDSRNISNSLFIQLESTREELRNKSMEYEEALFEQSGIGLGAFHLNYKIYSLVLSIVWLSILIYHAIACAKSIKSVQNQQVLEAALQRHRLSQRQAQSLYAINSRHPGRNIRRTS